MCAPLLGAWKDFNKDINPALSIMHGNRRLPGPFTVHSIPVRGCTSPCFCFLTPAIDWRSTPVHALMNVVIVCFLFKYALQLILFSAEKNLKRHGKRWSTNGLFSKCVCESQSKGVSKCVRVNACVRTCSVCVCVRLRECVSGTVCPVCQCSSLSLELIPPPENSPMRPSEVLMYRSDSLSDNGWQSESVRSVVWSQSDRLGTEQPSCGRSSASHATPLAWEERRGEDRTGQDRTGQERAREGGQ